MACMVFAGCSSTSVTFLTSVLPGATASVDVDAGTLRLSRGAAIAFECREVDVSASYDGPCRAFEVVVGDDEILGALAAHIAALEGERVDGEERSTAFDGNTSITADRQATARVLVGIQQGDTRLEVSSKTGTVELAVTVID